MNSKLILGDNLDVLKSLESNTIDLCYIDPPFFSNRNYEIVWGDNGEIASFTDRWSGGINQYISWLKERVDEIWRLLKPTGSLFLHCDWHANAYIRTLILDKLDGEFVNEIIWCYTSASNNNKRLSNKHDTIFWYAKNKEYTCNLNDIRVPYNEKTKANYKKGLKGSGTLYNGKIKNDDGILNKNGKIPEDWWDDIGISARYPKGSDDYVGYPTQKPTKLLERIIKLASNENDVVLDAFCGGGSTCVAARRFNRWFIGIDQSVQAIAVSQARLEKQTDLLINDVFEVKMHKYNYDDIRKSPPFTFEKFIIEKFNGIPNQKQTSDDGIDGKIKVDGNYSPIQVKRSDSIGRNVVDNFKSAMSRFRKDCKKGYIIAFSFGKGAVDEVARLKLEENINIELVKVDTIIPIADKINININYDWIDKENGEKEITFTAVSNSKVDMWQWDFNYNKEDGFKSSILLDKIGRQSHNFESGVYEIAVRAICNNTISSIEVLKIVVNGGVNLYS